MGERGATLARGLKCLVEYKKPGGAWRALPGPSSYRDPGLERERNQDANFAGSTTTLGDLLIGEVTIDSRWMPNHQSWIDQADAILAGTVLSYRVTFPSNLLAEFAVDAGEGVGISLDGVLDFANVDAMETRLVAGALFKERTYDVGQLVEIDDMLYNVDTIEVTAAGVVTVTVNPPPAMAVDGGALAAGDFSIYLPGLGRPEFAARVGENGRSAGGGQ